MTEKNKSAVEAALEAKENLDFKRSATKVWSSNYYGYKPMNEEFIKVAENHRLVPDVVERVDNEHAQTVRLHGFEGKGKGKSQQEIRDAAASIKREPALASAHVTKKGVKYVKSGTYGE